MSCDATALYPGGQLEALSQKKERKSKKVPDTWYYNRDAYAVSAIPSFYIPLQEVS